MRFPFRLAKAILKRIYRLNILRRVSLYIVLKIDQIRCRIEFYPEAKHYDFAADVTTLIRWNRPPVGLVRVQLEVIRYLLDLNGRCAFFYFSMDRKRIIRIKPELVRECCDHFPSPLQQASSLSLFQRLLRMRPKPQFAFVDSIQEAFQRPWIEPMTSFLKDSKLVLTGLDWLDGNFSLLYALKRRWNFSVLSCSHDDILIHHPEFADDISHAQSIFQYKYHISCISDHICCVSNYAKDSLCEVWETYSFPAEKSKLSVVTLGFDAFPEHITAAAPTLPTVNNPLVGEPSENGITENFVVYVSTIEPRKNHMIVIRAWEKLLHDDFANLPNLLIVGANFGKYLEGLQAYTRSNHKLERKVYFLNRVFDSELLYLYQNALFTVFPSYMDGWGVPIVESLYYGTPCIISDCPAFIEATQGLMPALHADDLQGWVTWIQKLCNQEQRTYYQKMIREKFQIRYWKDFAADVVACG